MVSGLGMTLEHRKNPRVAAPHVLVKISSRDRFRTSYLKDLSMGGLFVKTEKTLPIGSSLIIDLLPPGWTDSLRLRGVVVRSHSAAGAAGMAVRFENNEESKLEVLRNLVGDYQNGASPPEVRPEEVHEQLQRVLGQVAELKNALEKRDRELTLERARREEATTRVALLTADLELAHRSSTGPQEVSDRLHAVEAELAISHHEELELRTRLAELEGQIEAFKHENETLEQDDATSRRLAASLAKEKNELINHTARLNTQLAAAQHKLEAATHTATTQRASAHAPVPSAPRPVVDRSSFERRLRDNDLLSKTPKFDQHAPRDDRERSVLGLLQAGERFSELIVLGRGVVAPAELIDALFTLSSVGVIRFDEPKPGHSI